MREIPCPLCQSASGETIWRQRLGGVVIETQLCPLCGLVRHQPILEDSDREQSGKSYRQWHTDAPMNQRYWRRVSRRVQRQLDFLAPLLQPGWRALEVGAGLGILGHELQQQGCQVVAVEPDLQQAAWARNHFGLEVIPSRFEEVKLSPGFDLLVASHVIEHLTDPVVFLSRLRRLAAPGGRLFLETPNILAPKVSPRRIFSLAHNYYFSPATLMACLASCGWQVQNLRLFRYDSFMVLATPAIPCRPSWSKERVAEIRQAVRRHRWYYYFSLRFLWRKIPWWQQYWMYRFKEYQPVWDSQ